MSSFIEKLIEKLYNSGWHKIALLLFGILCGIGILYTLDSIYLSEKEHETFENDIESTYRDIEEIQDSQEQSLKAAKASILLSRNHLANYLSQLFEMRMQAVENYGLDDPRVKRLERHIEDISSSLQRAEELLYE